MLRPTLLVTGILCALAAPMSFGTASPSAAVGLSGPSAAESAVTQDDEAEDFDSASLEDLVEKLTKMRDDVDPAVITAIAKKETRPAMEALLAGYDVLASTYMRREVVKALGRFSDVTEAFEPALTKVANVATAAKARELREAAIETLGRSGQNGKRFLRMIVDSSADDTLRERALVLHVKLGDESDFEWYQKVYARTLEEAQREAFGGGGDDGSRKRKRRKKGEEEEAETKKEIVWPTAKLRGTAMTAVIEQLDDNALVKAFEDDRSMTIKRTALAELSRRGHSKAPEYARYIIERADFPGTDRALAAEILVKNEGGEAAKDLIGIATKPITPEVLRQRIADLLSDLKDEDVDKQLLKLVGKGKGPQKSFVIRATKHFSDEKYVKKIRKGLRDKEPEILIATVHALADRKDKESLEDMEKLLEKTKDDDVRRAVLEGISTIYDGENEWVERLIEYASVESTDLRNAALLELARLGRRNTMDVFKERLGHSNWSTRLIALGALEDMREAEFLRPIIDQMQNESGRMLVEFADALFRLTGKPFGRRATSWSRWLMDDPDSVAVIPLSEVDEMLAEEEDRRLKQISNAEFFGIRIESHRVLFIIDVSGSMNEPVRPRYYGESGNVRIDVAKEELKKALNALEPTALFNIAPFSGDVESWLEEGIATSGEMVREEAIEYVDRLGAAGGTNLYGSLDFAFEDPDIDTIFLLSDGEPSVGDLIDPQLIRDVVAERNQTRGIVINTISIGGQLQVLEWLAEDSGGTHVEIQ